MPKSTAPQPALELFFDGLALIVDTFPKALSVAFGSLAITYAVNLALGWALAQSAMPLLQSGVVSRNALALVSLGAFLVLWTVLWSWGFASSIALMGQHLRGRSISIRDAVLVGLRALPRYLMTMLVLSAAMLAVFGVLIGLSKFLPTVGSLLAPVVIILAFYWLIATMFWAPAVVLDAHGGWGAVLRSVELTRGLWWRTFAFFFVTQMLMLIALLGVSWAMLPSGGPITVGSPEITTVWVLQSVGLSIMEVYMVAMVVAYYEDLVLRESAGPPPDQPLPI